MPWYGFSEQNRTLKKITLTLVPTCLTYYPLAGATGASNHRQIDFPRAIITLNTHMHWHALTHLTQYNMCIIFLCIIFQCNVFNSYKNIFLCNVFIFPFPLVLFRARSLPHVSAIIIVLLIIIMTIIYLYIQATLSMLIFFILLSSFKYFNCTSLCIMYISF